MPSSLAQVAPDARAWKPSEANAENSKGSKQKKGRDHAGIVWLKDGEFVRPVEVQAGTSDGANTAIASDALRDGQEVVTGEAVQPAQSGTQNPFIPQFRRR
jgi:hypothetical protein